MAPKIIKTGVFEQTCNDCRTVFQFHFADTYPTRDYLGELNDGRYIQCPECKHGQHARLS